MYSRLTKIIAVCEHRQTDLKDNYMIDVACCLVGTGCEFMLLLLDNIVESRLQCFD